MKKILFGLLLIMWTVSVQADISPNVNSFNLDINKASVGDTFSVRAYVENKGAIIYDPTVLSVNEVYLDTKYDDIDVSDCIIDTDIEGAITSYCDIVWFFGEELVIDFDVIGTNTKNVTEVFVFNPNLKNYHEDDGLFIGILSPEVNFANIPEFNYIPDATLVKNVKDRFSEYDEYEFVSRNELYEDYEDDDEEEPCIYVNEEKIVRCDTPKNTFNIFGYNISFNIILIVFFSILFIYILVIIILAVKCKKYKRIINPQK